MKKKGVFFRVVATLIRVFYGKRRFVGLENIPQEPCLIIGNHAQANGPITSELMLPFKNRYTWCIGEVMDKKQFPEYAMMDFWSNKSKGVKWFYKLIAHILAPLAQYVFTNADCIAVYKDARVVSTFKNTVKCLKNGANIVIFPEEHTPYNDIVNEFQEHFVDVAALYNKVAGKEVSFVPMYNAPKLKTVVFGKPIRYNSELSKDEQREEINRYLKEEITAMAKALPPHTVIPYENVGKKNYKKSK